MPEFFLELFSEEIPARMQANAGQLLGEICRSLLAELTPANLRIYYGARRLAVAVDIAAEKPGGLMEARGPRESAPPAALAGFIGKFGAAPDDLVIEAGFYWLRRPVPPISAAQLLLEKLSPALSAFAWPKSMRWGQSGDFTWVRPLRRIVCLLDGEVLAFTLGPVTAGNETEGHRIHGPGPFTVTSASMWEDKLRDHKVVADPAARRQKIAKGLAEKAAVLGLTVAPDEGLLDEVTGLVEWPVPLIGKIGTEFMSLPPEVRELSMKVNQKYFALRDADGEPAPYFGFVANLEAEDGGAAIIAGNERVLRARLSDARHFWTLDQKIPLENLRPKLGKITFHAKLGTQLARTERIEALAKIIAAQLGPDVDKVRQAGIAGRLCKADLVTGMVGEFPELQGIIGGYLAVLNDPTDDGEAVGAAIRTHYQPKGPSDAVPEGIVACAVALADKLDTLIQFFRIGEKPTGSGDPYALRRAALGVIRIILENKLRLALKHPSLIGQDHDLFAFIIERLRVKLRGEGQRFDILDAVMSAPTGDKQIDALRMSGHPKHELLGVDDDLVRIMQRVEALRVLLATPDGVNLKAGFDRANNILQKEEAKDGVAYYEDYDRALLRDAAEMSLAEGVEATGARNASLIAAGQFAEAMAQLSSLRPAIDRFFADVTVNTNETNIRLNRLRLVAQFIDCVNEIADFSKIEG